MAHFHIKTKKGRPYLYVREIARVDGKPKVVSQVYIGSPERVSGLTQGQESDVVALKSSNSARSGWPAKSTQGLIFALLLMESFPRQTARRDHPLVSIFCIAFLTG